MKRKFPGNISNRQEREMQMLRAPIGVRGGKRGHIPDPSGIRHRQAPMRQMFTEQSSDSPIVDFPQLNFGNDVTQQYGPSTEQNNEVIIPLNNESPNAYKPTQRIIATNYQFEAGVNTLTAALNSNDSRVYLIVQNQGLVNILMSFGSPASGIIIVPGFSWEINQNCPVSSIYLRTASGTALGVIVEGTKQWV